MLPQPSGEAKEGEAGVAVGRNRKGQFMERLFLPRSAGAAFCVNLLDSLLRQMFQLFAPDMPGCFWGRIGYLIDIMADQNRNSEFLGGGPKFNTVGKDNRPAPGMEEPVVAPRQTGYWVRVAAIVLLVVVLAGVLFYLNDHDLSKTVVPAGRGGQTVSPDAPAVNPDAKPAPSGSE